MKKEKKDKKEKKEKKAVPSQREAPILENGEQMPSPNADPLEYALSLIGGKWKTRILWALGKSNRGSLRYGDLKLKISGITDMMFSQSLKELTASGLILRTQFQEIPPRVEYSLTEAGRSLLPAIGCLYDWSVKRLS